MQESYLGLWEAVQHYERLQIVVYDLCEYWIRQSVQAVSLKMRVYSANTEPHKAENTRYKKNRTGVRTRN